MIIVARNSSKLSLMTQLQICNALAIYAHDDSFSNYPNRPALEVYKQWKFVKKILLMFIFAIVDLT